MPSERTKKNIVVILSQYQFQLFLMIQKQKEIKNVYYIAPSRLKEVIAGSAEGYMGVYFYDSGCEGEKITFRVARKIIKNLKEFLNAQQFSKEDTMWTGNDENQIDQCVYNIVRFEFVNFIEDGIGSYVSHRLMKYNYGALNLLRKAMQVVFYFPYYRAFYGCGGNISANEGYSYHSKAFPMQKNINRVVLNREYMSSSGMTPLAPDDAVIFIGQPLVSAGYFSSSEYVKCLMGIRDRVGEGKVIIYRAHPSEGNVGYIEETGFKVERYDGLPVEDYLNLSGKNLKVFSFLSTSLLHINKLDNVDEVVALRSKKTEMLVPYYELISSFGIKVLDID